MNSVMAVNQSLLVILLSDVNDNSRYIVLYCPILARLSADGFVLCSHVRSRIIGSFSTAKNVDYAKIMRILLLFNVFLNLYY